MSWSGKDGDHVKSGTKFGVVKGSARSILVAERIALNFMQRMSGIATATAAMTDRMQASNGTLLNKQQCMRAEDDESTVSESFCTHESCQCAVLHAMHMLTASIHVRHCIKVSLYAMFHVALLWICLWLGRLTAPQKPAMLHLLRISIP